MEALEIHNISKYKYEEKNGDLVLTLTIPHFKYYNKKKDNDILKLESTINYINKEQLSLTSLTNSEILECVVKDEEHNNIKFESLKFKRILIDIYKTIPTSFIFQNSTMNVDLGDKLNGQKGYQYHEDIGLSIQSKDSNGTFKEICNVVSLNNYNLDIIIKLGNGDKIGYKI